jgi:hypothetical protein
MFFFGLTCIKLNLKSTDSNLTDPDLYTCETQKPFLKVTALFCEKFFRAIQFCFLVIKAETSVEENEYSLIL